MNNKINGLIVLILASLLTVGVQAQRRTNTKYLDYIDKYKDLAIDQMKRYKIPASITLAQGLLESGAGVSDLTRRSNNHFGIKCGSDWQGASVLADDDARNECFRAYKSARDSYEDHSAFLSGRFRYAFLFKLDITDYKGWALGLKKAGYATDPSYPNRLIAIIETYELYRYDTKAEKQHNKHWKRYKEEEMEIKKHPHQIYIANGIAYVVARAGDSFELLSEELGIGERRLARYNDLQSDYTLAAGDIIYLKEKNTRASGAYKVHVVREGDSMHSISQMYGIQLKSLYNMNGKDGDYVPEVGDRLFLQ